MVVFNLFYEHFKLLLLGINECLIKHQSCKCDFHPLEVMGLGGWTQMEGALRKYHSLLIVPL